MKQEDIDNAVKQAAEYTDRLNLVGILARAVVALNAKVERVRKVADECRCDACMFGRPDMIIPMNCISREIIDALDKEEP